MKIVKNLIKSIIFLILLFLALYTIFALVVPKAIEGASFVEIVKEIALGIWNNIKAILGF